MLPGLLFLGLACFGLPACEAQRPVVFGGTAPPGCRCVPLTDCPELRPRPGQRWTPDLTAAIQRLRCGFANRAIKVCCGGGQSSPTTKGPPPPTDLPRTCGDTNSIDRIFGGKNAPLGGNPWMVALGYSVPGPRGELKLSYECGATLVTRQHVVTAAHCVRPDDIGLLSLKQANIGEWNTDTDPDCFVSPATEKNICAPPVVVRQIAAATWHPQYNTDGKYNNDIAVVRFDRPVTFGSYVQPICIPNNFDPNIPASSELNPLALAVGWGATEKLSSSPVLQEIRLPLVDIQLCNASYLGILNENQICAGGETGEDTCSGDSGGPLVATGKAGGKYFLIGLTSFGRLLCGSKGSFGVYTAVHKYRDWIVQTLAV
ncbi:CLIP domain-containing serine protease HP8 isoform X1 [Hyalella azteca]|uniref:CLIP domain-containing serine protease n=1 Tax=Hyalella azteca TaxID=294128 RepID=A0A8B7N3E6_HYAAZ|nr:CLIP domain-containing serine protease HP8 isoform X1 [Hyalella azteca]